MTMKLMTFNAVLLSVLVHAFLLNNLIIEFRASEPPNVPRMVFLGPILNPKEFLVKTNNGFVTEGGSEIRSLVGGPVSSSETPYSFLRYEKPSSQAPSKNADKVIIKSDFLNSDQTKDSVGPNANSKTAAEDIGLDIELSPYKPLKIIK